jgi:hypothetical protein
MFLHLAAVSLVSTPFLVSTGSAAAQDGDQDMKMSMPGGDQSMPGMPQMDHSPSSMPSHSFVEFLLQHTTSGTDAEPNSTPVAMLMTTKAIGPSCSMGKPS